MKKRGKKRISWKISLRHSFLKRGQSNEGAKDEEEKEDTREDNEEKEEEEEDRREVKN